MKLQGEHIKSFPLFLILNFPSILSLQYKPSFSSPSSAQLCCCCCCLKDLQELRLTARLGPEIQRLHSPSQNISFSLTLEPVATHFAVDLISHHGTFLKTENTKCGIRNVFSTSGHISRFLFRGHIPSIHKCPQIPNMRHTQRTIQLWVSVFSLNDAEQNIQIYIFFSFLVQGKLA